MSKGLKKVLIVLIVLNVAFIWVNSCMPADISSHISDIVKNFLGFMDTVKKVRKTAHFTEFATLAVWLEMLFHSNINKYFIKIICFGLTVAFIDETIQLFVPGRDGQIIDVWIDIAGVGAGILAAFIIMSIIMLVNSKYKSRNC